MSQVDRKRAKLHELHVKWLPQPHYSPDLALSNDWLFADLKRMLHGKRFGSNEGLISETEAYFKAKNRSTKKALNCLRSIGISLSP